VRELIGIDEGFWRFFSRKRLRWDVGIMGSHRVSCFIWKKQGYIGFGVEMTRSFGHDEVVIKQVE
jgi:hypothetical protein